jgi:hypothetical protein
MEGRTFMYLVRERDVGVETLNVEAPGPKNDEMGVNKLMVFTSVFLGCQRLYIKISGASKNKM